LSATLPVQEREELPEPPVILVGESVHERLVELVVTASVTVPPKPFRGATVIVEVPATFTFTLTLVELAEMAKSWTW
jgi:hypothetical protein